MGRKWSQLWKKAIAEEVGRSAPARTRQPSRTRGFPGGTMTGKRLPDPNLCVYVIGYADRLVNPCLWPIKIGISNNLEKRLDTFQTANPHRLEILDARFDPNAAAMEKYYHRVLDAYRIRPDGEWFMPPTDVDAAEWVFNA